MDENHFKITLSKILEREYEKNKTWFGEDFIDVYTTVPNCGLYIEYTGIFTQTEWNTYRAILHLQVPLSRIEVFEKYHKEIFDKASKLFGKQDDYYLTSLSVDILIEKYETFDFSVLGLDETLRRAIGDASTLMSQGRYGSCIDRVHTALHGYLRVRLNELEVNYEESDMMPKLFNLLYKKWEEVSNGEINDMMLKALRSASATLDALNDIRNRYSLAHPNEEIVSEPEAKFVLGLAKSICDYMEIRKIKDNRYF
ncbi:hypothetical protein FDB73_01640 [Clostridium botulinum]|nr:hypothetical protein [Clostridium botulinum]NFP53561.1 hypothetical protein [Clostridium botulinum]NFT09193.1 hypothetical protein [Clostridium botulinum]NFT59315.1 hypothetical protein [Clostridium botulinum]